MFRITKDPSSGSSIQCLAKITVMVLVRSLVCYTYSRTQLYLPPLLQGGYYNDMFRAYIVGHLQVVIRLLDQLYRNAWSVLGEFFLGGVLRCHYTNGYHGPGFRGGISFVVCSAHFSQIF